MIKTIKNILLIFIIISCNANNDNEYYNLFIINENNNVELIKYPVSKEYFRNTSLLLTDKEDTVVFGNFKNKIKSGKWIYNFGDSNSFNLIWENFKNDNVTIIKDKSWEVNNRKGLEFEVNINKNTKFYLIKHSNMKEIPPTEYFNSLIKEYKSRLELDTLHYQLTYTDEPSLFVIVKYYYQNKEYLMFNFLFKLNGIFYDFTLSTIDIDNEAKYNLQFFEILQNTKIDSILILNPFKEINLKNIKLE